MREYPRGAKRFDEQDLTARASSTLMSSRMKEDQQSVPLVVRFGWMGDMVMLFAFIRALHERLGSPVDMVVSGAWTPSLLEPQLGVGKVHWIRSRKDRYWLTPQQWRLVEALRARGAGPTWVCEEKNHKGRWLLARAGVPDEFIVDLHDCPIGADEHEVDRLLRFAQATPRAWVERLAAAPGTPRQWRVPPLRVKAEWRADLDDWLERSRLAGRRLILIQPGSRSTTRWYRPYRRASNRKYWPLENWARVIDDVARIEADAALLLIGVPNEAHLNDEIRSRVRSRRVHNVARELPLARLLALQERAAGMISTDTGPAHSAAALGCPLVVIFGVEDPVVYTPRSTNDDVRVVAGEIDGERTMLAVSAEAVLDAWEQLTLRA
jgi:ADP-heptose:LPS heptosyltransferase